MKSGRIAIVGGLALGLGLFASFYLGFEVGKKTARQEMARMVTVFVAVEELRQGTVISDPEKQFVQKQLSRDAAPANAIADVRQLQDMQVLRTLDAGAVCTQRDVGKYEGLDCPGPPGQRAMSFRVQVEPSLVNSLLPGGRVDLRAILPNKNDPSSKTTKIVLRNALVLATGSGIEVNKNGTAVVTLAVTPFDAERMTAIASIDGITLTVELSKPSEEKKAVAQPRED